MPINKVNLKNFKSFKEIDISLGNFNVIVGPNAAGKSNFLKSLSFVRDTLNFGLQDAVSLQGGPDFLPNISSPRDKVKIGFTYNMKVSPSRKRLMGFDDFLSEAKRMEYSIEISLEGNKLDICEEEAIMVFKLFQGEEIDRQDKGLFNETFFIRNFEDINADVVGEGEYIAKNEGGRFTNNAYAQGEEISASSLEPEEPKIPGLKSILSYPPHMNPFFFVNEDIKNISIYNFKEEVQREAISISGKKNLEEDGSNLALVLRDLLQKEGDRRKFLNLINTLIPFAEEFDVERLAGRSLLVKMQESYADEIYLPSSLLSNGTINVASLIIALFFEDKPVVAFEEPATSLHPKLISQLMQMMREASEEKQIFLTTHHPEVIKHVELDNIYLVSRDEDGFSQISKPADKKEVRIFLENDLGVDDLFVQNLL